MFNRVKKSSARVRFVFVLSLAAIAVALVAITPASRAKVNKKPGAAAAKKSRRPAFVPGEVLVRYRGEDTAANKANTTSMMSSDGTAIQMSVEDFAGSRIVPGARIVRVAPERTLEAVQSVATTAGCDVRRAELHSSRGYHQPKRSSLSAKPMEPRQNWGTVGVRHNPRQ